MAMTEKEAMLLPTAEKPNQLATSLEALVTARLKTIEQSQRRLTLFSIAVTAIFFGGLSAWSETGIVVNSTIHTVGGVVPPGDTLMEVVPEGDQLVVEARIRPQDIEHVRKDLRASVRLIGFNSRVVPSVDGVVTYVSADSLLDRPSNARYYLTRISLNLASKRETANLKLEPGMIAQVMVITGNRTLFDYLLSPITDSISAAMHES